MSTFCETITHAITPKIVQSVVSIVLGGSFCFAGYLALHTLPRSRSASIFFPLVKISVVMGKVKISFGVGNISSASSACVELS